MGKFAAMILAGGRGKRMGMLCDARPKPVLPFAGRFRVIDFSLSNCVHSQIDTAGVLTDYKRSQIASYLTQWDLTNTSKTNFQLLEPMTGSYKGTADAVYQNRDYISRTAAENVLILAGDHVYRMDYRDMLAFHERVKADVTIGVIRVPIEDTYRFGTVISDSDGEITDFVEKARTPLSNLASMGIYIFNKDALLWYLREDATRRDSPHDFGYAVIPSMVKREKICAYEYKGYWQDIGTVEAYFTANMELVAEKPILSLNSSRPVLTVEQSLSPDTMSGHGLIRNSLVSKGCVIKGFVENSILSPGVWVEEGAVVKNSVVMANTFIGYHSMVHHCVLDEGVNIGKFCYIGFGGGHFSEDRDITVLGTGVRVPPHTAIGRNCKILPYMKPDDFNSNVIVSGTTAQLVKQMRQKLIPTASSGFSLL